MYVPEKSVNLSKLLSKQTSTLVIIKKKQIKNMFSVYLINSEVEQETHPIKLD